MLQPFCFFFFSDVVFRREPLWKVSMNIRVHPTVRCLFVADENVLRIVLKEAVGGTGTSVADSSDSQIGTGSQVQTENTNQEVVVYALKVRLTRKPQLFSMLLLITDDFWSLARPIMFEA